MENKNFREHVETGNFERKKYSNFYKNRNFCGSGNRVGNDKKKKRRVKKFGKELRKEIMVGWLLRNVGSVEVWGIFLIKRRETRFGRAIWGRFNGCSKGLRKIGKFF